MLLFFLPLAAPRWPATRPSTIDQPPQITKTAHFHVSEPGRRGEGGCEKDIQTYKRKRTFRRTHTSAVLVAEVWKPPQIAEPNGERQSAHDEIEAAGPLVAPARFVHLR